LPFLFENHQPKIENDFEGAKILLFFILQTFFEKIFRNHIKKSLPLKFVSTRKIFNFAENIYKALTII